MDASIAKLPTTPDAMVRAPNNSDAASAGPAPNAGTGAPTDAGMAAVSCSRCARFAAPGSAGSVGPNELDSLSGVASSRTQPNTLYAHNDHDRAVVYAIDLQGQLHATISLNGATASDIEDIALGPCGPDTCIYLADIGDNASQRAEYALLRFIEPSVPSQPGTTALSPKFERFRFTYPDGSHNAESLLVSPDGTLYIITKLAPGSGGNVKATGPSSVYRLAHSALSSGSVAQATLVATLAVPKSGEPALSAAAAHPCGLSVLLRTYDRVYELVAKGSDFESAFSATPSVVAMPDEPQSEGIDYLPGGLGFVTSGEGAHAPIMVTRCAP